MAAPRRPPISEMKRDLLPFVLDSFARLRREADIVLVEGAGSAAEINLRANDIANMGFARAADVPVVLIGDIDRGGVIASLVGTKAVLAPEDAALVRGFIVNKFRGDAALFAAGMERIAQLTGWEALGLVPFFADARLLPAEDALALEQSRPAKPRARAAHRGADPAAHRQFRRSRSARCRARRRSRSRAAGRGASRRRRSHRAARLEGDHRRSCGAARCRLRHRHRGASAPRRNGARPLRRLSDAGAQIADPDGIEGPPGTVDGLGLLDVETTLSAEKRLEPVRGATSDGVPFAGYEMHMGVTAGPDCARPFARLADGRPRARFRRRPGHRHLHPRPVRRRPAARGVARALSAAPRTSPTTPWSSETLDALAAHLAAHLDLDRLLKLAR